MNSFNNKSIFLFLMLLLIIKIVKSSVVDFDDCHLPLGMESREIADEALTASSSFDESSVGPQNARGLTYNRISSGARRRPGQQLSSPNWASSIRTEQLGGAWCPRRQIRPDVHEWIQVDLGAARIVTAIETQGRYGDGLGQEFTTGYSVEYWRPGLHGWYRYRNQHGQEVLQGNNDTSSAVKREIDSPFVASKLRIIPWSEHTRTVCIRFELYGCSFTDRVVEYRMPQGYAGADRNLADESYDGEQLANGTLVGGLGQLHDRQVGTEPFTESPFRWVGWRRSLTGHWLDIKFIFNELRNFTSVQLHCAHFNRKSVAIFSAAQLFFVQDQQQQQHQPLEYSPSGEISSGRGVRWIVIPVQHQTAKILQIRLFFAAEWLLISEIEFDSTPAKIFSNQKQNKAPPSTKRSSSSVAILTYDVIPTEYVALSLGVLLVVVATGAVGLAVFVVRSNRRQAKTTPPPTLIPFYAYGALSRPEQLSAKDLKPGTTPCKMSVQYAVNGLLNNNNNNIAKRSPSSEEDDEEEDTYYYSEYADPDINSNQTAPLLPEPPGTAQRRRNCNAPCRQAVLDSDKHRLAYSLYYASSDVTNDDEHTTSANTTTAAAVAAGDTSEPVESQDRRPTSFVDFFNTATNGGLRCAMFQRGALELQEKLGEGEFGEVHLCRLYNNDGSCKRVAVKTRRNSNADANQWRDFERELHLLTKLNHVNIVQLLGVIAEQDQCLLVFEHMENGDLNQYLRNENGTQLSGEQLLGFARQIANGMQYLESLNLVHRDLATRNCLLGQDLTIKIADFGMARSLYQSDYYRIEGRFVLPIRWMAWECVLLGKFSSKTDVWAYGVTLWEIYTLAREQPFAKLNDQQVIENLQYIYYNDSLLVSLDRPPVDRCPSEFLPTPTHEMPLAADWHCTGSRMSTSVTCFRYPMLENENLKRTAALSSDKWRHIEAPGIRPSLPLINN
ncbi:Discoidin domain-containing receptor 2 [Trichinella pseudospiralis]|uniref:receptor protein-tyrosine kinase n=1 Tax=Trichinella pseudospiralis TaxID=6337 RepID=A0A0V0Y3J4_TRIPS|nr:Discoidin domain-containing receptor 2 [Trichinella pseudospiralis]